MHNLVKTSYSLMDVEILLEDLSGKLAGMDTATRERLIQSGVHYSEMLPVEYKPTDEYLAIYHNALETMAKRIALGIAVLAEQLYSKHGESLVLISLARAGTPIGILIRRYIKWAYNVNIPHYSISIIRDRGIDINAMEYIRNNQLDVSHFQFIDGWTGKGVISNQLSSAVRQLKELNPHWDGLSDDLAVLADPANLCNICGTREDLLIPSACLNSTVSGLISRTILREDLIDVAGGDFHGAVYFGDLESEDLSIEFIYTITSWFIRLNMEDIQSGINPYKQRQAITGIEVVNSIKNDYDISDINLIKPGIGETTRVLLRRVPWKVLIDNSHKANKSSFYTNSTDPQLEHIIRLCEEKKVPIEYRKLGNYKACGIIKGMSADV